jgi:hypothetical protein
MHSRSIKSKQGVPDFSHHLALFLLPKSACDVVSLDRIEGNLMACTIHKLLIQIHPLELLIAAQLTALEL